MKQQTLRQQLLKSANSANRHIYYANVAGAALRRRYLVTEQLRTRITPSDQSEQALELPARRCERRLDGQTGVMFLAA